MKHIGLFEGIGGFSLAAEWMGWETVAWCEWNEFCQTVLKYYFPKAQGYGDIKQTDFKQYANKIGLLTGGFPCQPFSTAGEQLGEQDERFMFPEMFRAIREIKPKWIVAENVYGLLTKKFRPTLENIYSSLEDEGYEMFPPLVLPASAVNAPHERNRLWIIAYSNQVSGQNGELGENRYSQGKSESIEEQRERFRVFAARISEAGFVAYTDSIGQSGPGRAKGQIGSEKKRNWEASWFNTNGRWPTQSPICDGDDGFSSRLDTAAISKKQWTEQSLQAGGNAIVPQVAMEIFKAIDSFNLLKI